MPPKRGCGRKRPAEDASGEMRGAGAGGAGAAATKKSAAARGSATRMLMVSENIYARFDTNLSESHCAKLYICTILDLRFKSYQLWHTRKSAVTSAKCEHQYIDIYHTD